MVEHSSPLRISPVLRREPAPPNVDLLSMVGVARHVGIEANAATTFSTAYFYIERAYRQAADAMRSQGKEVPWVMPVEVEGHTIRCGFYGDRGRNIFGVHRDDAALAAKIREEHAGKAKPASDGMVR